MRIFYHRRVAKPCLNANSSQANGGFSIIELAVAMVIFSLGTAILWYGIRSSSRVDHLNQLHHKALAAAESELESIRLVPKKQIHDTDYFLPLAGKESLQLFRIVFDSTKMVNTLSEIVLDEKLAPKELHKPLEVQVLVKMNSPLDDNPANKRTLVSLLLKIPEYQWY